MFERKVLSNPLSNIIAPMLIYRQKVVPIFTLTGILGSDWLRGIFWV